MNQTNKPTAMTEQARKERVREVLRAASEPLGPTQIAERIGEAWCMWNGTGFGSAVTPVLRRIGAKKSSGKWSLRAVPAPEVEPGCVGELGPVPPSVMSAARWERIKAEMVAPQK